MSWKHSIQVSGAQWDALSGYIEERVAELAAVCLAPESSEVEIRRAQSGILELRKITDLPQTLRAEAQIRSQAGNRKGY